MARFGERSKKNLEGVDLRLIWLFTEIVENHHDCSILEGVRTNARQAQLVEQGKSKTMNSKHLVGKAVDVVPYPISWANTKRFYYFAGIVKAVAKQMGIGIRWGGDWDMDNDLDDQTFMDLVHFELLED